MRLMRNVFSIMCCTIIVFGVKCENNVVDRVTKFIVEHLPARRVTLILDTLDKVSIKSNQIANGILKTIPCLVIDAKLLKSNESRDRNVVNARSLILRRLEHKAIKILIIDDVERVEELLMNYVDLFTKFPAQAPRSKCIIIVFNRNNSIDFLNILKFSWSKQFLYITIIEIYEKIINAFQSSRIKDVKVHEYNPFKDTYSSTSISKKTQLFTNKLLNLYGHGMKTGFIEEIPLVMSKRNNFNILDNIYGIDSDFSKTLATVMNFSMIIKTNSSRCIHAMLNNNSIDFAMNIFSIVGYSERDREDRRTIKSIFMYPYSHHLIVKQRGYYKLQMSSRILSVAIIITTFTVLSVLIFFLPFDHKTWTTCNIAMILLGITTSRKPRKLSEKIFFLCLTFVSVTLSMQLWNDLFKVFLTRMSFGEMKTLAGAVEAGVVPALTKEFIKHYFPDDEVLRKLVNKSKTMEDAEDTFACVLNLLSKNETINACDVNHFLGELVADRYSNKDKDWIITFVEEPLTPCWTAMLFANSSPYLERFNVVLRRIIESGLVVHWHDRHRASRYFMSSYGNFFKKKLKKFRSSMRFKAPIHKRKNLRSHTLFLLISGYFLGCIALIAEIAWCCFRRFLMAA